jgi:hypothetical protein
VRFLQAVRASLAREPLEEEARLRFRFYSLIVVMVLASLLVFGYDELESNQLLRAVLILTTAGSLVAGWFHLRSGGDSRIPFRLNGVVIGLLLLYGVASGGAGGERSLWIYVYPMIVFFQFGEREGARWVAAMLAGVAILLFAPVESLRGFEYSFDFKSRLLAVFVVVSSMMYAIEYLKRRYRLGMRFEHERLVEEHNLLTQQIREREAAEREKAEVIVQLQDSLAQVKTLTGLIPICAHCHRIRDDRGYWNRLETYLHQRSHAEFSHGICPECMSTIYPGVDPDLE